jgi:hypothetical protein
LATDTLGTLQPEAVLVAGQANINGGRYGDYAGEVIDPDGCTAWHFEEYAKSGYLWGTWVGSFRFVSSSPWAACYGVGGTPTAWAVNQTQTYGVIVTNTGTQTWPAGGSNPVHLSVHIGPSGGSFTSSRWYSDQRFSLPNDLAPGASATLTISVTAPNVSGNLVLEYQMVKENQLWFAQFADINVALAAATWTAGYSVGNTPTSWAANQTQTYTVTVANTGNQTWPAGGSNPVHLSVHIGPSGGGFTSSQWYTDQRFSLPSDLAPGASATLTISVTAPNVSGNLVLEYQMVKENQFWFGQFADVNVSIH